MKAIALVQGVCVLAACLGCGREPRIARKPVSQWKGELESPSVDRQRAAAMTLGKNAAKAKPLIPDLVKLLQGKDPIVRRQVASTLAKMGPEAGPAVPELVGLLKHSDADVRRTAAQTLGVVAKAGADATAAVPDLVRLLQDPAPEVRFAAVQTLGQIGPAAKSAVPSLSGLQRDGDANVRAAAWEALRKVEQK